MEIIINKQKINNNLLLNEEVLQTKKQWNNLGNKKAYQISPEGLSLLNRKVATFLGYPH